MYCFLENQTKCEKVRELAEKLAKSEFGDLKTGAYVPSCEKDGSYSKTQCHKSTGFCWCVNENGEEIPGTKVKGSLNCDEGEFYKIYLLLLSSCRILSMSVEIFFLRFGDNKSPQISRTFLRILAEYKITLFCNSTIFVSIPMSSNLFLNSFGVVPKAPIMIGITFTRVFQIFFSSLAKS